MTYFAYEYWQYSYLIVENAQELRYRGTIRIFVCKMRNSYEHAYGRKGCVREVLADSMDRFAGGQQGQACSMCNAV